ncbi:DNA-binding transcriptional regulator YhcF (GntR family) [Mobilisporobacter senegalensis]|uniref:DNA-binding transcriptional regulator YhcF (GntR family) n=1 Tax=Mobilisporobacter senegalensis TaxID=1329262 RepID=A0A3N1XKB1_9FIRM|nr:GntR family transcriptional regulator [Mobilisporobacter senegalensis]ROR27175.1 DNA-binding transcriptional regulator YhcF (GntR family) [Mobilisporobacter senegalensis]
MDFNNNIPIYIQVIDDIKMNIIKGNLSLGTKLPSGRDLALQYKINPNTASRIYKELEMDEICFTKRGLGTYVTEDKNKLLEMKADMSKQLIEDFIMGMKNLGFIKEEVIGILEKKY